MWRLLLIIIIISIALYFVVKNKEKQQSHGRDRTNNELLTVEHLKDVYTHDILDDEMKKLFYEKP